MPGWKGGKALPLGGSFGEYSLNDLEEQPEEMKQQNRRLKKKEKNPSDSKRAKTCLYGDPGQGEMSCKNCRQDLEA